MEQKKILPPYSVEGYEKTGSFTDEDDADLQIFGQLIDMGSDLTKPRHMIHYFYFEAEHGAAAAAEELRGMDFHVDLGERVDSEPVGRRWPVTADRIQIVNPEVIRGVAWAIL